MAGSPLLAVIVMQSCTGPFLHRQGCLALSTEQGHPAHPSFAQWSLSGDVLAPIST